MKYISKVETFAIASIILILLVSGLKSGHELITNLMPMVNLPKIAFAGFISFAIVGGIMAVGSAFGIWFGKIGGSFLYAIVLAIIGSILF